MGLDAAVFRSVRNLERLVGHGLFDVDQNTGEAMPKPGAQVRLPDGAYVAAERRLGNLAQIGHLRGIVAGLMPADSLLMGRVMYSGSHCGDCIELAEIPELRREIRALWTHGGPDVKELAESMEPLASAAEAEQNPIVFT